MIKLYNSRINVFDSNICTLKQYEEYIQAIAIVESNSLSPHPDCWSEKIELSVKEFILWIDKKLQMQSSYFDNYLLYSKKIYYAVMLKKKRIQFQEPIDTFEYYLQLEDCRIMLEMAFVNANYKDTIDYIIEHMNLTDKIENSYIYMKTKGERMSIQDSNKIHNKQIQKMNEFVGYLKLKVELLKKNLKNLNKIDKVDAQIEIFTLESKIKSQLNYINSYSNRRADKC